MNKKYIFRVTSFPMATLFTVALLCVLTSTDVFASQENDDSRQRKEPVIVATTDTQIEGEDASQTTTLDNKKSYTATEKSESEILISSKEFTKLTVAELKLLAYNLEEQYQQLQNSLETEDAYSSKLGEDYFSYGLLLRDANQYDEAIQAFVNSLHIDKINQGLYSISQRAYLLALFETHFILNNNDDFNNYLERILWLEDHNPDIQDSVSFELLMRVGHYYLDLVDRRPVVSERTMKSLLTAKKYFLSAINHYGDRTINELFMPYTELALISYLESKLNPDQFLLTAKDDSRYRRSRNLVTRPFDPDLYLRQNCNEYLNNSLLDRERARDTFVDGYKVLEIYLRKANEEKNLSHILKASIALGDLHQLFDKKNGALKFYKMAIEVSKLTDQEELLSKEFSQPVALPSFQYAKDRKVVTTTRPSILVPIAFNVSKKGWVSDFVKFPPESEYAKYYSLARKEARKLTFRPKISSDGAAVAEDVDHKVRVYVKK